MFKFDHPQKSPLFDYHAPLGSDFRGILSIPHSGETIPSEFLPYLSGDERAYKEDVDYKVNELVDIQELQKNGIAVLVAHVHRICVDLNRSEDLCVLNWKENTQGKKLVAVEPAPEVLQKFIETYHRPYYEILRSALRDLEKKKQAPVSMVDLHSMPSAPTAYHLKQNPLQQTHRPDFCVSDRKGLTSAPEFIGFFQSSLEALGYEAYLNNPYVGGYITEYVNQFRTNNIQIEIKRAIYMDEVSKELVKAKAETVKAHLTKTLIEGFVKFDS
jgi:N-formylglutamate amidohydrolase